MVGKALIFGQFFAATRWGSTFLMIDGYFAALDTDDDASSLMPMRRQAMRLRDLLCELRDFRSVTMKLQEER